MVNPLRIGKGAEGGLLLIGRIPGEAVNDLCQKVAQIPLSDLSEENILNAVSGIPSLSFLSSEDRAELSDALKGLHYVRATFEGESELLPEDIIEGLRERLAVSQNDKLNEDLASNLLKNLRLVFEVESLRVKQKALSLAVSQERLFTSCRILTDIRPVYSNAGDEPIDISAAFVFHTLKISFIEDDESKYFYISLDADDLEKLKLDVDRAVYKGNVAKQAISKWTELINTENR